MRTFSLLTTTDLQRNFCPWQFTHSTSALLITRWLDLHFSAGVGLTGFCRRGVLVGGCWTTGGISRRGGIGAGSCWAETCTDVCATGGCATMIGGCGGFEQTRKVSTTAKTTASIKRAPKVGLRHARFMGFFVQRLLVFAQANKDRLSTRVILRPGRHRGLCG